MFAKAIGVIHKVMASVLLIDDDIELVEMLRDYLVRDGFSVDVVHEGEAGIEVVNSRHFDVVVLDIMLPGMSGLDVLARIRKASAVPVIMLTGRGEDADRIIGLELGADDYVSKPCTPRELAARIRAILKRVPGVPAESPGLPDDVTIGLLTLQPARRKAFWKGTELTLTGTEFDLLMVLAHNAGRPVSKEDLSLKALGRPLERFDRCIDVHMSSIRAKIGHAAGDRSAIRTIVRKGYQLLMESC
jgi:DNA-binding response OmpR family regulator